MQIEGYFGKIKTANETVEKLKALGFKEAFVDMNDHYNENRNVQTNLPGTEASISLSGLVLRSNDHGTSSDKAPLNAASPMVSGYGAFDETADINCKVVVESGEGDAARVKQVIRDMGGDLESPNIKRPKIINNEEAIMKGTIREAQDFLDRSRK